MMHSPLTVTRLIERAGTLFGSSRVATAVGAETEHQTWSETADRAGRLAAALRRLGVGEGDCVATLAWNTHRHVELYFGVPALGAVLHTVNVRLAPAQIERIVEHGGARVLLADPDLIELVDPAALRALGVEHLVSLGEAAPAGWLCYETLLGEVEPIAAWPTLEEDTAAGLCYTSGTTGEPKGVLYSHRALALHTLAICLPDGFALGEADTILPAVPMFHANAWGLVHAAAMTGAALVLPGVRPEAARLAALLADERVTFAAGVPTVWMAVLEELRTRPRALHPRLRIHSGGAPTPPSVIEAYRRELGVEIITGWGMTELTPVGMVTHPRGNMADWPAERLLDVRTSQGTPLPFIEARVVSDDGGPVPPDGVSPGELEVRGPWVTAGYYRKATDEAFRDGWLRTGDVATHDERGYFRLVDRTKDLIRSGGEWISSVQLEHALMAHAAVAEAAVIAVPDAKWGERPWACVVLHDGRRAVPDEFLAPLESRFPRWWLPDRVLFLDALPRTATGKFDKRTLRERMRALAGAAGAAGAEEPVG